VTVAPAGAKEITAYAFLSASNAGLGASVVATISGTSIVATVPAGSNVTALIATFSTTGARVTVAGAAQASGANANNFTGPVVYRVTAADGSTQDFTVTVTVASATAKAITAYAFLSANNGELARNAIATIGGASIAVGVPIGTDVTALVATFSTTGASVSVAGTPQISGTTANNFTRPVIYRVTAADGSTQDFTVTVTPVSSEKDITDLRILIVDNRPSGVFMDLIATITGTSIVIPPSDISISSLVARFSTTGVSVTVGGIVQVSGVTHNDFSRPLIYRVTAEDGSTQDYTVMFGHF
jgi:hypothetical protein